MQVSRLVLCVWKPGTVATIACCPQKLLEIDTPTPRNMPSEYFSRLTGD